MENIKLDIGYNKIQILSFHLKLPETIDLKKDNKSSFGFSYKIDTNTNLNKELFFITLDIKILYSKKQDIICSIKTYFEYHIKGLKKIVKEVDNKKLVPDQLPATLIANAVSTSRGILYMKTLGTPLDGIFLPIVNSDSFSRSKVDKIDEQK